MLFSAIVVSVRTALLLLVALAAIVAARFAREAAGAMRSEEMTSAPFAPSPRAAPFISLGYRELAADLLMFRFVGYFGANDSTPQASAALAESIVALDTKLRHTYEFGALAMTDARRPPDPALQHRALALLETGMREFPNYWRLPYIAGSIYLVELQSSDPAQRREWDEKGSLLIESASRKPGAPRDLALQAAALRTKLGQKERAIASLKEMILITTDPKTREALLEQLARVTAEQSNDIVAELLEARRDFDRRWRRERPAVPATFYVLIGPPLGESFDLEDLAAGGTVVGTEGFEQLEPLAP